MIAYSYRKLSLFCRKLGGKSHELSRLSVSHALEHPASSSVHTAQGKKSVLDSYLEAIYCGLIKHFNCFSFQEPKCCIFKKTCFGENIEVGLLTLEFFSLSYWICKCDCLPDTLEPSRALADGNVTRGLYSWDVYTTVCKFSHMRKSLVCPGESLAIEVCGVVIDISTREVAAQGVAGVWSQKHLHSHRWAETSVSPHLVHRCQAGNESLMFLPEEVAAMSGDVWLRAVTIQGRTMTWGSEIRQWFAPFLCCRPELIRAMTWAYFSSPRGHSLCHFQVPGKEGGTDPLPVAGESGFL